MLLLEAVGQSVLGGTACTSLSLFWEYWHYLCGKLQAQVPVGEAVMEPHKFGLPEAVYTHLYHS